MRFLAEHECGFDSISLGFPSIHGCLAVVFLTQQGLYGFHNFGGSGQDHFAARAKLFGDYVRKRNGQQNDSTGIHLYGASFISSNLRGYGGSSIKATWTQELKTFASDLGFNGPISGCDLCQKFSAGSAYVDFQKSGQVCVIQAQAWSDALIQAQAPNPNSPDQENVRAKNQPGNVITSIDRTGLTLCTVEALYTPSKCSVM